MADLGTAVEKTRRYAAFFKYFLDADGLHRWLISPQTISDTALSHYAKSLTAREVAEIKTCRLISERKINLAHRTISFLSLFSSIRLVAITGSLAVKNARPDDDIDLMIITSPDTLWLTRLFLIPLVGLFFRRRLPGQPEIKDAICLNLWLDETTLAVPENKRNLYTAHEVLQAMPIFDRGGVYQKFIKANSWTKNYLANAYLATSSQLPDISQPKRNNFLLPAVCCLLSALNFVAYKIQYSYMKKKITKETITLHSAYFHPRDLSKDIKDFLK